MVLFVFFIEFYDRRLSFQAVRPLVFFLQHYYFLVSNALIGVSGLSKPASVDSGILLKARTSNSRIWRLFYRIRVIFRS